MTYLTKISFLWLCFLLSSFRVTGQTTLTVFDAQTREGIPEVLVRIPTHNNLITDENGQVQLQLDSLHTEVLLSHISYQEQTIVVPITENEVEVLMQRKETLLQEVIVSSFGSERPLKEQAAGISHVSQGDLQRFNETSLVHAFNTKPGVRVEERAPASYRISIRGSSLRAPFGVRNVKVYWNDIPFTAPDGTTPLNLLDLSNVENAEIIKGPAGSIYGAGNGGVVSLSSKANIRENKAQTDWVVGDYGLMKYRMGVDQVLENGHVSASYVRQKANGYRDHSAMDRETVQVTGSFSPSSRQRITTQWLYSDLFYELPGALNTDQLAENREQARPGSAEQNASILQKSLYGTLLHTYDFSSHWSNHTSVYINTSDFENPFNLDYKKETQYGYGGRSRFVYDDDQGKFPVRVVFGGEYQFSNTAAQNFGNREGVADTVRFSDDLITTQAFLFQQLEVNWTPHLLMTVGLSENFSRFGIERNIDAATGIPYQVERKFEPVWVPRLAASYQLNDFSAAHVSVSSGFSPPTIDEVRTNEGTVNLGLEAEKGTNYEAGYRAYFGEGKVNLDLTAFYFQLEETITTYTNEQGVVLFRNAGATDQKGVEAELDYALVRNPLTWLQELKLTHAYSGHFFTFENYVQDDEVFSGNQLTGAAPHTLVNQLDVQTRPGFYLNFTHQWVDEIPLNDGNTVFQDAYHLVNARTGWKSLLNAHWGLEVYGGVENLLNEQYSLGNDLNAFGGRYYQPAALRNFYGGMKIAYRY